MTDDTRALPLQHVLRESDRGCPEGFRAFHIQPPSEADQVAEFVEHGFRGGVMREENYLHYDRTTAAKRRA